MKTIHHTNGHHSEQSIRERAYALWQRAGKPPGRELDFWLDAEHELTGRENLQATIASAITEPLPPRTEPKPKKTVSENVVPRSAEMRLPKTTTRPMKSAASGSNGKTMAKRAKPSEA